MDDTPIPDVAPEGTLIRRKQRVAKEEKHRIVQSRAVAGLVGLLVLALAGWIGTTIVLKTSIDNQATVIENQGHLLRRRNVATDAISCFSTQQATFSSAIRDVIQGAVDRDLLREIKGSSALNGANFDACAKPSPPTTTTTTVVPAP